MHLRPTPRFENSTSWEGAFAHSHALALILSAIIVARVATASSEEQPCADAWFDPVPHDRNRRGFTAQNSIMSKQ
jgi:hypothetical protein